ncbi:MAG: nicotinate (nicotinamide) nucleotide adenylyltransferase [Ruminococcaceae bacterium]|nr:nicotinate (nicotinamide) nucleotide adenylyltransferase [Oscillospiraceae bacterium]
MIQNNTEKKRTRPLRIAMFGGTYDPIHWGHMRLCKMYADRLELDKVYVVPTKTPPHKASSITPEEHRLEMCRLALEELDERFIASDIELRRDATSYSFYTVCALREMHPDCRFFLLCGADMFVTLENWHRFDELKELVTFCTVQRDDIDTTDLYEHAARLEDMGCSCFVTEFEPVSLSSTMIRRKVAAGESISGIVPELVEKYILENGLYRSEV